MATLSRILTFQEEEKLSVKERLKYYEDLREYLLKKPYETLSLGSEEFCKNLNPILREVFKKFCGYEIITEGQLKTQEELIIDGKLETQEKIINISNKHVEGLVGIYAYNHTSKYDHITFLASNPNHATLVNSNVLSLPYKMLLNFNKVIYFNKLDKAHRAVAKLDMTKRALEGYSLAIFLESAWCLSPNKLMLPMRFGALDIARKSKLPIIPVIIEYEYDETRLDGKEHIKTAYVYYGDPFYVKETDNIYEKWEEYLKIVATMRWNTIENKGVFKREEITNKEYINKIEFSKRNLKNAGIDIDVERQGIYGADKEDYLFSHINDVAYNEKGELLETEYKRYIEALYDQNQIKKALSRVRY